MTNTSASGAGAALGSAPTGVVKRSAVPEELRMIECLERTKEPTAVSKAQSLAIYTLSRMGADLSPGADASRVPFQANLELLRLFLTHRGDIVESIEAVLNARN